MMIIKIAMIAVLVIELWYLQMLYKREYNKEFRKNMKLLEYNIKSDDEMFELYCKVDNLERELLSRDEKYNKLLAKYNSLKEK